MGRLRAISALGALILILASAQAFAISLGDDITIFDGMASSSGWYGSQEDQEVEPGNVQSQVWDLEGFYLDGTSLTMVGGFDFANGQYGSGYVYRSGDLFIDVDGDAQYGPANTGTTGGSNIVANTFGYDYALDFDFDTLTYSVYALDAGSSTVEVYYGANDESNPWRYNSGGTALAGYQNVGMGYYTGLSDGEVAGLLGGTHNAVVVDLSFLGAGDFTTHFTLECGNDNLMGSGAIVPEPATVSLLGIGLAGLLLHGVRTRKA